MAMNRGRTRLGRKKLQGTSGSVQRLRQALRAAGAGLSVYKSASDQEPVFRAELYFPRLGGEGERTGLSVDRVPGENLLLVGGVTPPPPSAERNIRRSERNGMWRFFSCAAGQTGPGFTGVRGPRPKTSDRR